MNTREVKKLRQMTRKAVGRAAEEAAKQANANLQVTAEEIMAAVRETWSFKARLELAWWLLFGRQKWKGERA